MRVLLLASSLALNLTAAGASSAQTLQPATVPLTAAPSGTAAALQPGDERISPAAAEAVQVVDAFMADLASGQLEAARQLMTPEATVMANGQFLGNRDGYIDGAAKGDAAALRNTQGVLLHRDAKAGNDFGLVVSEKRMTGAVGPQGAPRELVVTETMVLARSSAGWKITQIHWSGH